jgi:uncharacterized protein YjiS (DUF1127 family)
MQQLELIFPADSGNSPKKGTKMFTSLLRYLHAWRSYGLAIRELSYLNDQELADLGITRADIPRVAWESARN